MKLLLKKEMYLLIFFSLISSFSFSQNKDWSLDVGFRMQKTVYLYYENGITANLSNKQILDNQLLLSFSYTSSRMGSAISSNALKQDNVFLSAGWLFRHDKTIRPLIKLTTGWFHCDYESELFNDLPANSTVLCLEPCLSFKLPYLFTFESGFGYHLLVGDGLKRAGTVYPLFFQFNLTYKLI